ncbi:stage III sporulation protein SpoIIIAB [Haloimpatiens sp. FM7315]|uniref:stage III sporulation protein SpoIIIAB n=1 Tax=Haloimpatiens sp. FM7315 TaxID=3298609 RepID=UPI0035A3BCB5
MFKLIGSLIIILSCSYLGFSIGSGIRKRLIQLKELEKNVYLLKNEMFYTYTSLPEAFSKVGLKSKGVIKNIFVTISDLLYSNEVSDVYEAVNKSIKKYNIDLKLIDEDIDIVLNLAKSLGNCDLEGQKSIFELTISNLKKQILVAEDSLDKNVKMYRCLGVSIGAMIVIMLI